jgi:hypothetical protein
MARGSSGADQTSRLTSGHRNARGRPRRAVNPVVHAPRRLRSEAIAVAIESRRWASSISRWMYGSFGGPVELAAEGAVYVI